MTHVVSHSGEHVIPGNATLSLSTGDRLRSESPCGGGFGRPRADA